MAVLLGQSSAGTSADFFASSDTAAFPFTAAASGLVTRMWCQLKVANPSFSTAKLGIYSDSAGAPLTLLGSGTAVAGFTGTGLFFADMATPIAVVSGTQYWLAVSATGEQADLQGTSAAGVGKEGIGAMPGTWSAGGNMAATPVIWGEDSPVTTFNPLVWMYQQGGLARARALQILFPLRDPVVATTPVSASFSLAVEAAQGIAQTSLIPDESAQGISTSSSEPVEALQAITAASGGPIEANTGVASTAQDPIEALAGAASNASEPVESRQAIASTVVEPVESLSTASASASDPVESLQGIASTVSDPVEAGQGISTTATEPVDAAGAVASTVSEPVEELQGVSSTSTDPVEAQGNTPVAQTAVLPFEALAGGITAAPVAPFEALGGVRSTASTPVESVSPVSRALVTVFEALAGAVNAIIAPFESATSGISLSGPADTARTRSGPGPGVTSADPGSGRTRTSPGTGLTQADRDPAVQATAFGEGAFGEGVYGGESFSGSARTTATPDGGETTTNLGG